MSAVLKDRFLGMWVDGSGPVLVKEEKLSEVITAEITVDLKKREGE